MVKRVLTLGIISIIFFACLITVISLFFPSHIRISKAIDIRTGRDSLISMTGNAINWKKWYPGADSASYYYVDGSIKGITTADGRNLVIKKINDSLILASQFGPGAKEQLSGWNIFPGRDPGSFTVQWYMDFYLRWYPWEKFSSILLEKRYGPMMEKGLDHLKGVLEK